MFTKKHAFEKLKESKYKPIYQDQSIVTMFNSNKLYSNYCFIAIYIIGKLLKFKEDRCSDTLRGYAVGAKTCDPDTNDQPTHSLCS